MTTLPIEVIVQDAEAPVVPGEDGTNINTNTEAAVAVPDTGSGIGNIFTGSTSNIALPAILLVLAIVSIVAILIHKYHKQKNNKTTRKEKLAVATSSTVAILAVTVLIGNLVIPATKAATSDITDGIVPAEDKISITVTRDGGSAEESTESKATITSTSDFGYKVLLSMAEGVETASLYLDGDETSEYYIAPVEVSNEEESVELADNTWGYALAEDGVYSAVPLLDDAATVAQGDEPVEDAETNIYYGVKVSSDLPAGIYSGGEVEYTLEGYNGFPSTLTTMQGMTHEICESVYTPNAFKADGVTIEDNVPTATLKDIRDNKTYTIAKLADGKCWMTQNLDLQKEDLLTGVTLDSTNTNEPAIGFELPNSQTSGDEDWMSWSYPEVAINTAHVYDLGDSNAEYESYGNYYNWYTATAGTGTYNIGESEGESYEAVGSICPAGWRLPNNSNEQEGDNYGATDYSNLLYQYGILKSANSKVANNDKKSDMFIAPLSLIRAGRYDGGVHDMGYELYLWSSLANSEATLGARSFEYSTGSLKPWALRNKYEGLSVRCVAE